MNTQAKITGADVARVAGVSRATVSYVLNATPGQSIPEETRRKVKAAAEQLGYVPHMAGRTLRRGRSDLIVWILPDWPIGSAVGESIELLTREASSRGFTLAMLNEGNDHNRLEATLRTLAPAAVVSMHRLPDSIHRFAKASGVTIVSMMGRRTDPETGVDILQASISVGDMQVRYLAERGHSRIGYLYPDDVRVKEFAIGRYKGAREAAKALDLPAIRKRTMPLQRERLGELAVEWREQGITAVCAYNDEWAMALLSGMRMFGLEAPHHLAVIGCDNVLTAAVASPPLTSIDLNLLAYSFNMMNDVERALGIEPSTPDDPAAFETIVARESA